MERRMRLRKRRLQARKGITPARGSGPGTGVGVELAAVKLLIDRMPFSPVLSVVATRNPKLSPAASGMLLKLPKVAFALLMFVTDEPTR